jgi:hypothetical protein
LSATRKSSGYEGEAIIDPENKLVRYFKENDMVEVAISEMKIATGRKKYEFGMAQPAILVLTEEGEVLESWAIIPSVVRPPSAIFSWDC